MCLGSRVAVAVAVVQAGSCNSDLTPRLGTSICRRCGPKNKIKKKSYTKSLSISNELVVSERSVDCENSMSKPGDEMTREAEASLVGPRRMFVGTGAPESTLKTSVGEA